MAKKEFVNPLEAPAQPDPEVLAELDEGSDAVESNAVALRPTMVVGEQTGYQEDQVTRLPRLGVVYGVSDLIKKFPTVGALVLEREHLIAEPNTPIEVVILSTFGYLKEYISTEKRKEFLRAHPGEKLIPKRYADREAALQAGEIVDWPPYGSEGPKPTVSPAKDVQMLIKKPADLICGLFGLTLGGAEYAPAQLTVDKTAYKHVFGNKSSFVTTAFAWKQKGLLSTRWSLYTEVVVESGNQVPVPMLKFAGYNTPEFMAELKAFLKVT